MIVRLDTQTDCAYLCKKIQEMIDKHKKRESLDNKILSIKIVDLLPGTDHHIPKLEYKE
jgi:hypothetical protein